MATAPGAFCCPEGEHERVGHNRVRVSGDRDERDLDDLEVGTARSRAAIKDSHLTFGGVAYFRAHAEDVELGSIGERRSLVTKENYLEVKDRIPVNKN